MFNTIKTELERLKKENFTGGIKFGIEYGKVVSVSYRSLISGKRIKPIETMILTLIPDYSNFFGSIDYEIENGIVIANDFVLSLRGPQLDKRLERKCKVVKIVDNQ